MKNRCFQRKAKRLLAGLLALVMMVTAIPPMSAFAAAGTTKYSYDGYDVEYTITGEWSTGQNVEVEITNTGDKSILNWAFRYDAGSEIVNIWNAIITENQGTEYVVKNNGWNYEILPQQSISFGYTLAEGGIPVSKEFELYSKRVEVTNGYEVKLNTINEWGTGAQAEIVISNTSDKALEAWEIAFDCNFTIDGFWGARKVDFEGKDYGFASEVWSNPIPAGGSVSIGFTASIDGEMKMDNFSMTEVEIEKLEIDWEDATDTDGDMLPDVYEIHAYETDPKKADTDGDNLPDGYEVLNLYTNPTMTDSDSNGISDALEDFDTDGLTNYEEYELGTKPYCADTDEDYLDDGEEVNVHATNPLNPDTDGDTILDGDEVLLGLLPKDGTDGSMPMKQTLTEEELYVNEYNDEFKVSIVLEASNNVERFLEQGESAYAGFLADNRAIIGTPISLKYEAGVVSGGSITFRLEEEFIDNNTHLYPELGLGIERYGVFSYDETINTIVPVPCEFDDANNCIVVDAKYMGDLFLMDYESLMYDLGIEPEVSTYATRRTMLAVPGEESIVAEAASNEVTDYEDVSLEEIESIIAGDSEVAMFSLRSVANETKRTSQADDVMRQVDLVLAVDTTGSMGSQIAAVKRNVSNLISKLREDGISLYVSVVDYRDITCDGINSTKVNNNSGVDFYNATGDISLAVNSLRADGGGDGPETALDALGAAYNLDYRDTASKFVFLITDANYKNNNNYGIDNMAQIASELAEKGIVTSVVTYTSYNSYYRGLTERTGGELISMSGDFCDAMYNVIKSKTPASFVVIANNLVTGSFKETLVYGGTCDTDYDGLTDSAEIDWKKVKKVNKDDGTYTLYTWKELCKKGGIFSSTYDKGKEHPLFELLADVQVIPATSNPFSRDTDKDYYPDDVDKDKLTRNAMYIDDSNLDDREFHSGKKIVEKEITEYTDGDLSIDDVAQITAYTFYRRPNEKVYFSLKPQKNAYYRFVTDEVAKSLIRDRIVVTYKKGFLWKETVTVSPEKDGTYLLKDGTEYIIEVTGYNQTARDYDFMVRQDNWIEAKDGGLWYPIDHSLGSGFANHLSKGKMYIPTHKFISAVMSLTKGTSVLVLDPKGNIEEQINQILVDTGMYVDKKEFEDAIGTLGEAGLNIVQTVVVILFPEPKSVATGTVKTVKMVLAVLSNVSEGYTYFGTLEALDTISAYFEQYGFARAYEEGDTCVAMTKYYTSTLNTWSAWIEAPYICKFSVMGDIGDVKENVTDDEIIQWCEWEAPSLQLR